jgi:phospholipase C
MISRRRFLELAGTTAAGVATTGCGGRGADNPEPPPDGGGNGGGSGSLSKIEHIIFTMQENRSFDHYFGKLPQYRQARGIPGEVDGLPANASNPARDDPSQSVSAFHIETVRHENLSPSWNHSHRQRNRFNPSSDTATLDGFVYSAAQYSRDEAAAIPPRFACDFDGTRAMGFYDERDLPYYYELFSQFPISDRNFCSVMSATVPNRMFLLAGSCFGHVRPLTAEDTQINAPTIFELLEEKGVSWKIYLNDSGPRPHSFYQMFTGYQRNKNKVVTAEQFFSDVQNGSLPQVAMIESGVDTGLDEHPLNRVDRGAAYMRRFFDALMKSSLWTKSAMILTYDEGGGFFDHVPPPAAPAPDDIPPNLKPEDTPGTFERLSFRVPLVLVSAWARKHHVSHNVSDHTSIMKLIQKRFGLRNLTRRDAWAPDLTDMFDFSKMSFEQPPQLPGQPNDLAENVCNI